MEVSPKRRETVEKARQSWIKKLIDLSRRNNLIYYRSLKWGTLNLSLDAPDRWASLLCGDAVPLASLVEKASDEELRPKALAIWRKAQANQEEKGLATIFVALGMASWKSSDEGRNAEAPVLLLPVALEMKGHSSASLLVHRVGPVQVNLVLLHVLQAEFGISVSPEKILSVLQGDDEQEVFDPTPVHDLLKTVCTSIPEFQIRDVTVLGNFAFQKMAMVRDLQDGADNFASIDIIAALAGDADAKQAISAKLQNPDPKEFDRTPPQSEFLVLDADSSQQSAISAVMAEQSVVIHGPPGTGKSQTIANLVASLAAAGKHVLFVAEKRAALQVVLKRLEQVGLDKIAIDLHGADVSSKRVTERLASSLSAVGQATAVDCNTMHQKYVERRQRLNHHVEGLHRKRSPSGMSVYELQGAVLHLQAELRTCTRWRALELSKIEKFGPAKIRDLLREAGGLSQLFLRCDPSPWNNVTLQDGTTAQRAVDLVSQLSSQTWPDFVTSLAELVNSLSFRNPTTLRTVQQMSALLDDVRKTLGLYSPTLYKENLQALIRSLSPGRVGGRGALWAWCTSSEYRRARSEALSCRTAGRATSKELFAELSAAEDQLLKWAEMSARASQPQLPPNLLDFQRKFELASSDLAKLGPIVQKRQFDSQPIADLTAYLDSLAKDRLTPLKLPKLWTVEQTLAAAGVGKLVEEFRGTKIGPDKWIASFDLCWYSSCLEAAQIEDPEIAGFNGRTHDAFVEEFKELDRERIRISAARVRRAYAERAIAAMNEHKDEEYVIRSEAEKKRRHRPLRQLFADARHVLTAICPCWMASPLSVSQLLDTTRCFDFVVFDEASQVLPEDAIPAIIRGAYVVIAGDTWQLPPTSFFAAADDDELAEDESNVTNDGYESLLNVANSFMPSWYLDWHYRSRDEALISFSNHHIYKDRLVTFPGPGGPPAVRHVLVNQPLGVDGQEESCSEEVRKVVELVLEHAEKKPHQSLGVIAMGIRHADRLQRALDQALASSHNLGQFFDASAEERFFVKNLERVQGDERDAIILTVGYGKDRGGNLPFRFGPLLSLGGQRRLNVAVTRARQNMTLVSSFSHLDMDTTKIKPGTGVELLHSYLEYAASGGKRLGNLGSADFPMNSFEAEVFDVLTSAGIPLISQVGASSYRIDLVAQHPKQPGRYVLAIECDGASYHSSPTARDRDRLRQQQLENLGWKFHRIWSTDWFMRKDEEVSRAMRAYQSAVADVDGGPADLPVSSTLPAPMNASQALTPERLRGTRPWIQRRESITEYSQQELSALIDWIASDGRLRSDEEIIEELLPELGFHRRGVRIEGILKSVLQQHRSQL